MRNEFDKVIGYEKVKRDLLMYCDCLKNPEKYKKIGASMPHGILFEGCPGTGKTLMAECFMDECRLPGFVIRKKTANDDFLKELKKTFKDASDNSPAVILLDDMDKFSNNDSEHTDTPEYATIQSLIDEYKDSGIFYLATANSTVDMPESLRRPGRFDWLYDMDNPGKEDSEKILTHYLLQKELSDDVDAKLIVRIMNGCSCAEIEEAINKAALYAAYEGKEKVGNKELIRGCLGVLKFPELADREGKKKYYEIAVHEIGHAVVAESISPGSVVFSALFEIERNCPFGVTKNDVENDESFSVKDRENEVMVLLGGKAAVDAVLNRPDIGCGKDIIDASWIVERMMAKECAKGFEVHLFDDVSTASEWMRENGDRLIAAELQRYYEMAKKIIRDNRLLFDRLLEILLDKRMITFRDIQAVRAETLVM